MSPHSLSLVVMSLSGYLLLYPFVITLYNLVYDLLLHVVYDDEKPIGKTGKKKIKYTGNGF